MQNAYKLNDRYNYTILIIIALKLFFLSTSSNKYIKIDIIYLIYETIKKIFCPQIKKKEEKPNH